MAKKVQVVDVQGNDVKDEAFLVGKLKAINAQKALLEKEEKEIKKSLTEGYFANASRDGRGNSFFETVGLDGKPLILKREARKSVKIDEEKAQRFFAERKLLSTVTKTTVTWDEEAIEQLLADGIIDMDDLESILVTTTTYALKFVSAKEEEPDAT